MAEPRDADLGANALANAFQVNRERGAKGPGYFAADGVIFTPSKYRKSGKMLRRMVHHKLYLNNETELYLIDYWVEVQAAVKAGVRDPASGAFAVIGQPFRPVKIWDASIQDWQMNGTVRRVIPWDEIAEYLADRPGDR
jgi:hypothetical protein